MKRKANKDQYTHSPWSGKAYAQPPTMDALTRESKRVLNQHPTISKAIRLEAMDKFIEAYKAQ